MAKITKRLSLPVGSWVAQDGKQTIEYRDIGVVIEFEGRDGNKWQEIKLNLDILNPALFILARQQVDKTASQARVKLFDLARKTTVPDNDSQPPGQGPAPHEPDTHLPDDW